MPKASTALSAKSDSQTPFERFTAALSKVVSVPKSSLPQPIKKSRKK